MFFEPTRGKGYCEHSFRGFPGLSTSFFLSGPLCASVCLKALLGSLDFVRSLWASADLSWIVWSFSGHPKAALVFAVPLWVSRDLPWPLCFSGLFELLSPSLAPSRGLWASTDLWISLGLAGILWTSLDLRGFLNLSGPLGIFGAHLGFSGPFRISLGLLGALLDYIYVPFWVSLILSEPLWGFLLLPGPL